MENEKSVVVKFRDGGDRRFWRQTMERCHMQGVSADLAVAYADYLLRAMQEREGEQKEAVEAKARAAAQPKVEVPAEESREGEEMFEGLARRLVKAMGAERVEKIFAGPVAMPPSNSVMDKLDPQTVKEAQKRKILQAPRVAHLQQEQELMPFGPVPVVGVSIGEWERMQQSVNLMGTKLQDGRVGLHVILV